MGDEFFAGKAGPAVTSAAAAAAANAASAGRGANPLLGIPPQMPFEPFDMNDAHPMKVPVPSDGRGKKGGGRGGGGRTPHRKAAPQPPPPPSFQQAEWDASAFQQAIPPAYGIPAAAGMAYPPAPAAGMAAPYPVPCPPMPGPMQMYGMTGMMPFMYPPIAYPHMPSSSPPQPPEKTKKREKTNKTRKALQQAKREKSAVARPRARNRPRQRQIPIAAMSSFQYATRRATVSRQSFPFRRPGWQGWQLAGLAGLVGQLAAGAMKDESAEIQSMCTCSARQQKDGCDC